MTAAFYGPPQVDDDSVGRHQPLILQRVQSLVAIVDNALPAYRSAEECKHTDAGGGARR